MEDAQADRPFIATLTISRRVATCRRPRSSAAPGVSASSYDPLLLFVLFKSRPDLDASALARAAEYAAGT